MTFLLIPSKPSCIKPTRRVLLKNSCQQCMPYYVVFDGYTDYLRAFQLQGSSYTELELLQSRIWINDIQLGLGLLQGV
ncbi:hypothetical protein [Dendronalium sp. ChiSLP03b]|uniref:hypothetical protein n=1 Tax=Dendronalium sp. ChiSLP03b TaxID=3075381 RepID=UPI002AD4D90F|nr:hypothetical protein [Dendronalium sp. ChiSLP03b]MDZ8207999.1 hypothetical protein [Dendronalium sp. ChiSLP03b]